MSNVEVLFWHPEIDNEVSVSLLCGITKTKQEMKQAEIRCHLSSTHINWWISLDEIIWVLTNCIANGSYPSAWIVSKSIRFESKGRM